MNVNNSIKYIFSLFLILVVNSNSWSQEILVSPAAIDESGFGYSKVIGQDDAGYFVLLSNLTMNSENDRVGLKNRKYKITWFNKSLVKKWSKPIDPPNSDASIDAVSFFNGQVIIVTSSYIKHEQKVKYTFNTIDSTGVFSENKMA